MTCYRESFEFGWYSLYVLAVPPNFTLKYTDRKRKGGGGIGGGRGGIGRRGGGRGGIGRRGGGRGGGRWRGGVDFDIDGPCPRGQNIIFSIITSTTDSCWDSYSCKIRFK